MAGDPPKGYGLHLTLAGVSIPGHDRFPMYYGAEFTGQLVDLWVYNHGARIDFSRPGNRLTTPSSRPFNGTPRDECLNLHWFDDIAPASRLIEARRRDYNESRPHMALGKLPRAEYATRTGTRTTSRG
jgi:putative transposase